MEDTLWAALSISLPSVLTRLNPYSNGRYSMGGCERGQFQ